MKRIGYYRIIIALLMLPVAALLLVSYATDKMLDDVWKQLGVTEKDGKFDIGTSFREGYATYYTTRNAKKIAMGDRKAVTMGILEYTKKYVNSEAFQKEYLQFRDSKKPQAPQPLLTKEEVRAKMIARTEEDLKNREASLGRTTNPDTKASYEKTIARYKQSLVDYKDPNNNYIKMSYESEKNRYKYEKAEYDKETALWESNFPATTQLLIKKRLQQFLEVTQDIDYGAELKDGRSGKKLFVNPVYEKKSSKWKMGFRAGKDVTESVRAFAQQWIKEIQ
jgi:hypothetical protein